MPRFHTALMAPLIGFAATLSTGCGDVLSPPTETTGAFQVSVVTAGPEWGPEDGYRVSVNGGSHQAVALNGGILFTGLTPGTYRLQLMDVPPSCIVHGDNPRSVTLRGGTTGVVSFHVSCRAMGSMRVTVVTTGVDPDPDGYAVTVSHNNTSAVFGARVPVGEAVSIPALDAGDYVVALHGLALNCEIRDSTQRVTVVAKSTTPVTFTVACGPVPQLAYVAYGSSEPSDIYIINANNTGVINLTNHKGANRDPAWSPNGRTIAFTSERDGSHEIWLMNADGSDPVQLTRNEAPVVNQSPGWSPDGRRIVFQSSRDGDVDIYVMNADGTGPTRLTNRPGRDLDPAWSSNGRIAFVSERDGNAELYMMNSDGTSPVRLTNTAVDESGPAWSPDGRRLAFARTRCTGPEPSSCERKVLVLNVVSLEEPRSVASGHEPAWSPNGRIVAYTGQYCGWYDYYYGHGYDTCYSQIALVQEDGMHLSLVIQSAGQAAWRP